MVRLIGRGLCGEGLFSFLFLPFFVEWVRGCVGDGWVVVGVRVKTGLLPVVGMNIEV